MNINKSVKILLTGILSISIAFYINTLYYQYKRYTKNFIMEILISYHYKRYSNNFIIKIIYLININGIHTTLLLK